MDTSETYIKMCDCPEIRASKLIVPDLLPELYFGNTWMTAAIQTHLFSTSDDTLPTADSVWLPRQDQLQGMLPSNWTWQLRKTNFAPICYDFRMTHWREYKNGNDIFVYGLTPEQALIQGVMYELHNKTWNGKEWKED